MAPLSMTLIDPWPVFKGHDIFQHWYLSNDSW